MLFNANLGLKNTTRNNSNLTNLKDDLWTHKNHQTFQRWEYKNPDSLLWRNLANILGVEIWIGYNNNLRVELTWQDISIPANYLG